MEDKGDQVKFLSLNGYAVWQVLELSSPAANLFKSNICYEYSSTKHTQWYVLRYIQGSKFLQFTM